MSELDQVEKSSVSDLRGSDLYGLTMLKTEAILKREYLSVLKELQVSDIPKEINNIKISEQSVFFDITKLVYTKEESYLDKLTTIVNAAYVAEASLVSAIICDAQKTRFLIGIVKKTDCADINTYGRTLEGAIKGNFPGSTINKIQETPLQELLNGFSEYKTVSSISNIPSIRDKEKKIEEFTQGIEKLVDALGNEKYCILTISDSVPLVSCNNVRECLSALYKQLSGFEKTEIAINENYSTADSDTFTESYSRSIGTNTSVSQAYTTQTGWSISQSDGLNKSRTAATVAKTVGLLGTAAGVAGAAILTGGASVPPTGAIISATIGTAVGTIAGVAGGAFGQETHNTTTNESGSTSDTTTMQEGSSVNETNGTSIAKGKTTSIGEGKTLSFTVEDKTIKNILDEIDQQLERVNKCVNYGAFNSCTYIMAEDSSTNMLASSMFNALIAGEQSGIQNPKVNIWGMYDEEAKGVEKIIEYLKKLTHPSFHSKDGQEKYNPSSMVNGEELALQLGFPKKSISGLSVVYRVPFGRNIIRPYVSENTISIGKIYNLGEETKDSVELDLKSIASHVFITGSTGTGKSNAMYKILESIQKKNPSIHFLVIEPAKGEYKHAFYNHPTISCHVYGTNPKKSDLLRINPFSFPEDVHVLEHVDRLVEIMNVCWPMYAAMPAILKNAVIKSYEQCGWNVTNSYISKNEKVFPCFADVLANIREILDTSAFSADNKGDYTGALCTRVESLTYGLNGQIFTSDEIEEKTLFDENVIVDLSRVGASDTKALIMGILVMKLQEYRLSQEMEPNQSLNHVVVLEEAHNLLKKTSTEQSMEGSNLVGKSVEMLTNAIAEMRTYGEGFFIVDQAPDLLDKAVIRNTNTKIVLRLPDDQDRTVVGRAMALSDEQILELSKLELGCAAVYQNDWEEAVLCQFSQYHKNDKVDKENELFRYNYTGRIKSQSDLKKDVLRVLLDIACKRAVDNLMFEKVEKNMNNLQISYELKKQIKDVVKQSTEIELKDVAPIIVRLYGCEGIIEKRNSSEDLNTWNENLIKSVDPELRKMSKKYMDGFVQCILIDQARRNEEFKYYADNWASKMGGNNG